GVPPRRAAARAPPRPRAARWRPRAPLRRTSSGGLERLGLLARGEGVDDRVELAVEHALERVQRQARPVVGHAALREVVGAELLVGEVHLDVLRLGQHGHGHRRGVDAALRLRHRDALHAVHAALELQPAVGALALHEGDNLFEPAEAGRARGEHLHPPALSLGVAAVHAKQLGGEETRLLAARTGADLEHHVALVVRVARHEQPLEGCVELLETLLQPRKLAARQLPQLLVLPVRELPMLGHLARHALPLTPAGDGLLELRALAGELGELPAVGDHLRVRHETLELLVSPLDVRQALEHRAQVPAPARPAGTGLRGLRAGTALDPVLALEALDPAGGIDELLLAREERMARRADLDVDLGHGGAGLDDVTAGTDDL